jgi:hypothetical protein
MEGGAERRPPAVGSRRFAGALAVVLAVALVASRVRLVSVFGGSWTDEDQALLWFAARELRGLRFHEPYFYGQPYGSWLESLLAAPLLVVGVPVRLAAPIAGAVFGTVPWLGFAAVGWWRRRSAFVTVAVLAAGVAMSTEGMIVSTMPWGLLPGVVLGCLGACAVLAWPRSRVAAFVFGLLMVVGASMNVGSALVTAPVAVAFVLDGLLRAERRWQVLGALAGGLAVGDAIHVGAQRYYVAHRQRCCTKRRRSAGDSTVPSRTWASCPDI